MNTTDAIGPASRDTEYLAAFCSGTLREAVWWEARPTPGDLDTTEGREWEEVEVLDLALESLPAEQGRRLLAAAARFVDAHPELAAFDLDPVDVGSAWWMAHRGPDGMPGLDFRTFKAIPPDLRDRMNDHARRHPEQFGALELDEATGKVRFT
ncbi:hypothetical protein [Kitasatospora sp. NBC_01300]|uniref:hypothetical protein n=1 Tax=Kitasatospora sp. NBC_01300 TaxID=2903574 RepID=UPI002F90E2B0|nr:hypothetical protein OG556_40835 [Kitasatospora sp. NBC_01300]